MATVTVPTTSTLPVAGGDIIAAPLNGWITNLKTFVEGNNIDENNVDYSNSDGIVVMGQAQTITGLKTFENTSAAAGGVRTAAIFSIDPTSGTPTDGDGVEILFQADDDEGNVATIAELEAIMTDTDNGDEDSEVKIKALIAGAAAEFMVAGTPADGAGRVVFNDASADIDFRIETNNIANGFVVDAGLDVFAFGAAGADDKFVTISPPAAAHATTVDTYALHVTAGGAQTIPSGTTALVASVAIEEPNITATGTVTSAATLYIKNAPTEGGSNYALWVDDGAAKFDSTVTIADGSLTLGSTAVTSTAAEINLIDGGTARGTDAVATGDGLLVNDGGTMKMTNVDTVSTYFSSHSVGGSNIVTTGALNSGSITSGFGTIDTGSSTITTTGVITSGGFTIGSAVVDEAELEILDGATVTTAELNILDGVTSTAAELNILDGVTSTAAELNILDGVTSTTAELNILDGVTSSTAELNILDGVTSTAAEINLLDALDRGSIIYGNASGATTVLGQGGAGTVLTSDGDDISWAASTGGHTIEEEGTSLAQRTKLNFIGASVTVTDDSGDDATDVTIGAVTPVLSFTNSNGGTDNIALSTAAVGESLVTDSSPQLGGNLDVNGQSIVSDASNENIPITPHGTGSVVISKADINGGAIDATAIGATSASTGAFTTIGATGALTVGGSQVITGQSISVGEAPSTWASAFDFIQVGGTLSFASQPGVQADQNAVISQNAHYDSDNSWEYQATDEAEQISMTSGNIIFSNAVSGSAGANITWLERMRISSEGYVMIGTTGGARKFEVAESANAITTMEQNNHASFSNQLEWKLTTRTGSDAFSFLHCTSGGGGGDLQFNLRGDGNAYADGSWGSPASDYAEYFESTDGSALDVGKSIVFGGDGKVRVYDQSSDSADNIIGIVRPRGDTKGPSLVGNNAWNHWHDKYLTDDWGVYIREDVTVWEWDKIIAVEASEGVEAVEGREEGSCYERNEAEDWTPPAGATSSTQSIRKLNPAYSVEVDDATNYSPRADRAEWNLIGLLGQVQIKANEPTNPRWLKMKDISDAVELWMIR